MCRGREGWLLAAVPLYLCLDAAPVLIVLHDEMHPEI